MAEDQASEKRVEQHSRRF